MTKDIAVPLFFVVWVLWISVTLLRGRKRRAAREENMSSAASIPSTRAVPLGDPVAAKTSWVPTRGGGQNFDSYRLARVDHNRLEFKGTLGGKFFSLVFLLPGILLAAMAICDATVAPVPGMKSTVGCFLAGLVFAGAGIYVFPATTVFDRCANLFMKGKVLPWGRNDGGPGSSNIPLERIYAIQILSELVRGKRTYCSHELNLVLEDGSRVNVVDQGGLEKLREEADTISRFLGRPVWEK